MLMNEFKEKMFLIWCELKAQVFRCIRHIPKIGKKISRSHYGNYKILSVSDGRKVLAEAIKAGEPYMAARFGTTEGAALYNYHKAKLLGGKFKKEHLKRICLLSGFFPESEELLFKWAELETEVCKDVDLLGVMHYVGEEWITRKFCKNARLMPNGGLGSARYGWAPVLEGRKVLVIHPFAETIEKQYREHREEIFPGTNALPLFDLQCIKAVQTIADAEDERFSDWFEALDYMTEEIKKRDFDVALIGCGAYGFILASRVKKMGKIAVHMGGSLQTLFGIKGSRWDANESIVYNDAWVYPSKEETPKGFKKVEGGCYWSANERK